MFRVTITLTGYTGGPYINAMHFGNSGGETAQDAADAAGAFWAAIDNLFHNTLTWTTGSELESVNESTGQIISVQTITPVTGTGSDSSSPLPPANQMLCRWRTGNFIAGRELRGRTFIPGLTESSQSTGAPDAAWISGVNTAAAALIADADSSFGIYSPTHNEFAAAVSGSAWTKFAVLRKRRD